MHRKFIALIAATAIAITGFTAPARAGGDDVAKALAGLAAVLIIGAAINSSLDNSPAVAAPSPSPAPASHGHSNAVSRYVLPGQCERRIRTDRGYQRVLGANCVARNYSYARSLPDKCVSSYWIASRNRLETGYTKSCLQNHGYRIARY